MILIAALATSFLSPETSKEALENAIKHYRSLSSYSVTIECYDGSGLFPGEYAQTLKWKKDGRFEIVVNKKIDYVPKPGVPGGQAPDYFSNGTEVMTRRPDGTTTVRSLAVDANTMPGWEVTTGILLSWLQNTHAVRFLFEPPQGFKVSHEWGGKKEWEGMPVREAVAKVEGQGVTMAVSLILSQDNQELVGYEYQEQGKRHWVRYRDAKENPDLPAKLGDHPK